MKAQRERRLSCQTFHESPDLAWIAKDENSRTGGVRASLPLIFEGMSPGFSRQNDAQMLSKMSGVESHSGTASS